MSYQPHYIASFEDDSGLNTAYEPFIIPEKAFPVLEDAYCFRGRVMKRLGFTLLGQLRRVLAIASLGKTGATPWTFGIYATLAAPITGEPDAQIEPGSVVITIAGPIVFTDNGDGTLTGSVAGNSGTINYATGSVTLTHTAGAGVATTIDFAYFPGLPVMGLRQRELPGINSEMTVAFDTKYSYQYNYTTKKFQNLFETPPTVTIWHGNNAQFFWSTNYWSQVLEEYVFFASNCNMSGATRDPMRVYNGTTWTDFVPVISGKGLATEESVFNAEIIIQYKDRILLMNTWEGKTAGAGGTIALAKNFPNRVRWSSEGNPLDTATEWQSDVIGLGSFNDAYTAEAIISAEYVKDTILVKFERSSWKLVETGDRIHPFIFVKINTELGAESKFSLVPFDRGVFAVGNVGITTDDSVNVQRIDHQIPNQIFKFGNTTDGVTRVHGIRDYFNELVYWTYPTFDVSSVFPNRMLVYNYRNNTFANFTDSFTCLGYFQYAKEKTWAELTPHFTWEKWVLPWNSGVYQALFPNIVAGNQQGFVEVLNQDSLNDSSLFIKSIDGATGIIEVPNHNLEDGNIIQITGIIGDGALNPESLNDFTFKVTRDLVDPTNKITLEVFQVGLGEFYSILGDLPDSPPFVDATSIYLGGGLIAKFNNFNITTKVFAPFYEQGAQCRLGYIDYLIDGTSTGEVINQLYIDENPYYSMSDSTNVALLGSNVVPTAPDSVTLYPFQSTQKKIWHRKFFQVVAQNFQVQLTMSDVQNATEEICASDMTLHAMAFYLTPNARLTP